ncbi:F-box/kelch-repeat protein At3g06240-like [Corylus avellana]|uniref:F-box/kelch-repeat protein At3g06240-like n=1 Tax=Corylus avellana TaxID=13451 RepID=UPI00286AA043|nr:F-box/kelch-repeat protein At3g06240-like [Corylus avellana]
MTDGYRLVRLVYLPDTYFRCYETVPSLVEIYTLQTGIWRSITAPGSPYIIRDWSSSVFVNGVLHWLAHTWDQAPFRNVIVSFNMKDEAFGELSMPKSLQGLENLNVTVALVDGLLALVPCNKLGNEASEAVWVMKEYGVAESWSKLFDICIGGFNRVIGFTNSCEALVHTSGRLFSFRPCSPSGYLDLPIGVPADFYLDTYVESLVLLNVKDRVPGRHGNSSGGSQRTKKTRCLMLVPHSTFYNH